MIGADHSFMDADENVGRADGREDGRGSIHLSDTGDGKTGGGGKRGREW